MAFKLRLKTAFIFNILFLFSQTSMAGDADEWQYADPTLFTDVESLFVSGNCRFVWPLGYLYDPTVEKIVSRKRANELYPDYNYAFGTPQPKTSNSPGDCEAKIGFDELKKALNANMTETEELIVLYFDVPYDPKSGQTFAFNERVTEQAEKRFKLLSEFDALEKYFIRTPMTGLKPQAH